MKKILIILLFTYFNINAQNENQKKKELIIKNNISEILTYQFNQNGDSIQTGIDIYDKKGNIILKIKILNFTILIKKTMIFI